MILYVYDANCARIGLVEDIRSLQWLEIYQDAGEVKLVCSATTTNLSLLVDGNRLYCTDQTESAIIRETSVEDSGKDATLTVRALLSASRWEDRTVMATERITNVEAGMLSIADKHRRGLPGATAAAKGLTHTTDTQITWGSVLSALKSLAKISGYGFREVFAPDTGVETIEVYEGVDRTSGDAYNGYFGDDVENLSSIKIVRGTAKWKNTAVVGGAGDGTARTVVTVTLDAGIGDDRRELWVDAKDISTTYQVAVSDGSGGYTYTTETYEADDYTAMLAARGLEKLAEQLPTMEISAELGQGLMQYGIDYQLGDIVPIKHTRYGLSVSARISQAKTVYERGGKIVTVVLNDYKIKEA